MATTTLQFQQQGGEYVATYTSGGDSVVQLARAAGGPIRVYAYIDGMTPISVWGDYRSSQHTILKICVPAGVKVNISSDAEVTDAKLLTAEGGA